MIKTLLVVADNSKARIFKMESRSGPLQEIEVIEHPNARSREKDITSDLPGRASGNTGAGGHAYDGKVSPKDQDNFNFARQIAHQLDDARKKDLLRHLILVAAPDLLGNIRQNLTDETKKTVYHELAKNLAHLDSQEITTYVADVLREKQRKI